ncbi:SSI family serine proteinase inhibitor [Actinoplanes sp. NPDC023801]|uniref:SSI family serine proteinase inhibitor n=1 Tax=Actinoplanes sp. NPDC023801 TaxID=3154595 RepID=UPI0033CFA9DC
MTLQYRIGILAASLCAAVATVPLAAPAQAAPATDHRATTLLLSVQLTEHPQQAPRTAVLRCGSDGGTHVRTAQACEDLRAVNGDLQEMVYQDGPCTLEYLPLTATAVGLWEGRPVLYRNTFSNRCDMLRATGNVFRF